MARWEFKLPDIGEGITEGEIVSWLVAPGDQVREDQPIVEVMTDKATVTITAPKAGKVVETRGKVGEIVAVHAVLLVFELDGDAAVPPRLANGATGTAVDLEADGPAATAVGDLKESLPGLPGRAPAPPAAASAPAFFSDKPLATPATRKLARDLGVDLRRVPPSGPQGRVTKADVESFVRPQAAGPGAARSASRPPVPPSPGAAPPRTPGGTAPGHPAPSSFAAAPPGAVEERVPLAGLRRRIAQRMATSKRTAAHFTFVEECDAGALKALRARLVGAAAAQGVKLTYLPFIVKAVVAALKRHPALNASLDDAKNEIVYRRTFHIGVATATDAGLVVPVVKDADRKSVLDVARDIERLAGQARASELRLEDVQGSTFTVTSLGPQSGLLATPIINYPEVAILGVHRIKEKPVVKNGQIVVGDVMLLSLSFDHRVVDGHVGAAFAYELIAFLETPERLLLETA